GPGLVRHVVMAGRPHRHLLAQAHLDQAGQIGQLVLKEIIPRKGSRPEGAPSGLQQKFQPLPRLPRFCVGVKGGLAPGVLDGVAQLTREGGAGAVLEGPGAARVEEFLRRLVPPLARPGAQPQAPGPGQRQAGPAAPEPQVGPFQPARGAVSPFFLVAARLGEEPEPGPLKGLGPEAGGQGVPQLPFGGPSKAGPGVGAGDLVLEDLAVERPPAPECSIPRAPAALHRALVAHVLVEVGALLPPPALGAGAQPQGAQLLPQAQVGPFLEKGLSFLPPPLLVTPYA